MRLSIEGYANDKADKMMIDDDMLYEDVIGLISSYNPTNDFSSKRYVALSSRISTGFTGPKQKELQERLDKQKETGIDYQFNKVGSDAINSLNKLAFVEEVLGQFRKINLVQIQDEDRVVSVEDIKANTLFDLPDPDNPSQTVRRVPTQADVNAKVRTGTNRYVIPVKPNSVSYLKYTGEGKPLSLVEIKKDEWEKVGVTTVYDEDLNAKSVITDRVKNVREILEKEIREGNIKNSQDAVKRMNNLISGLVKMPPVNVSSTPVSTIQKTTETVTSPSDKKKAVLEILKR